VILVITCLAAAVNFFVAVETLIVFYGRDTLHLSESRVGVVVACGGLGGVLGAAVASRLARHAREEVVIVCGIAGLGAALALFGAADGLLPLAVLNLLMTACTICAAVLIRTLRQRVVPHELLGRVTATSRMIAFAAYPIGAMLAGLITGVDGGDPRPVFAGAGLLSVALAATAWATGLRRPAPPLGCVASL
jgi:predicted MFS family arabinose efflux permease